MHQRFRFMVVGIALFLGCLALGGCEPAEVTWESSYEEALARAQTDEKMMLVWVTAPWCIVCTQLEREAWTDGRVQKQMANYVNVEVNVDEPDERARVEAFYEGSVPQILIMDSEGRVKASLSGYPGNQNLATALREAARS